MDKTLLKGLMVLETISRLDGEAHTLEQIAVEVGLTRSNTHRTLQSLAHAGYVRRDASTGAYVCTLKMFELGARQLANMDVRRMAPPFMRELAPKTGETVHLSVLDGLDVVYIDKIDSPQPLLAYSTVGGRAPAYAVATGKALLAFQTPDYIEHYAEAIRKHTEDTHVSLAALKQELADVARIGYAINRGEWRLGIGGIAAPVFNGLDKVVAALGISGPLERLTTQKMAEYAPLVQNTARQLSAHMGYRGGYFGITV
ncbi:IclR family transcriptional regulator [Candidimonas sp. SYP-B2681]|uniref:IclR family transcriptional regulator n=1 Tax=Candidimonas sp. SYP-B2681 TaxID=2497686 RepID=UPI0021011FDE|nr:IclR family transcriptional regulator [Candidimonas sp. SYP-B2681]